MPDTQKTCAELVESEWESRRNDLKKFVDGEEDEDLGDVYEYPLCFDYVEADTFKDQPEGYYRIQFSWGGPGDEIQVFLTNDLRVYKAEYWYFQWFDGDCVDVTNDEVFKDYWSMFWEEFAYQQEVERRR